jgi:hypothetical protein
MTDVSIVGAVLAGFAPLRGVGQSDPIASANRRSMNWSFRLSLIGILSGAVASAALLATLHYGVWSLVLGVAIGAAYSAALRPTGREYADNLMAAGAGRAPQSRAD